jgi:hypothetical protein
MTALLAAVLRDELRDRRALARHARRHGLRVARLFHLEIAIAARRRLRNLEAP